jgi:hypothetical protein
VLTLDLVPQVTFVVEGRKVPAHRFILQVRSEHFRAMFSK